MCKESNTDFLVTKTVVEHLEPGTYPLHNRGEVTVRGKTIPIEVYEVV
jgi:hypothetical protein